MNSGSTRVRFNIFQVIYCCSSTASVALLVSLAHQVLLILRVQSLMSTGSRFQSVGARL